MKIQINLWGLLANKRMTVKKLSELTGISQQQLGNIKHGKTQKVEFETLSKLMDIFECQIEDLFLITSDHGEKK